MYPVMLGSYSESETMPLQVNRGEDAEMGDEGMSDICSAQKPDTNDFDRTILRSRVELPYPLNYLYHDNPAFAYVLIKVLDRIAENGKVRE